MSQFNTIILGYPMKFDYFLNIYLTQLICTHGIFNYYEVCQFGQSINYDL